MHPPHPQRGRGGRDANSIRDGGACSTRTIPSRSFIPANAPYCASGGKVYGPASNFGDKSSGSDAGDATPSLDEVRWRIDAIDGELLALLDERAGLARARAAAKQAAGDTGFGLPRPRGPDRPQAAGRPRTAASDALVIRIWRELMSDSLTRQGPYHLTVWGGPNPACAVELTRLRFGVAPPMTVVATDKEALAAAETPWGVSVLGLAADNAWWGRLLAEPRLKIFAALPCLER